jgi:glycosyltransferase involved in cell wall biosynthesis
MIQVLEIENQVKLLGFINREDQLCLMKNAVAIIQPSLFEGWSTVIEDAKALRAKVIASDINVHREQLNSYGLSLLFGATNEIELAKCLLTIGKIDAVVPDYRKNVIVFAENFRMIIDNISNN